MSVRKQTDSSACCFFYFEMWDRKWVCWRCWGVDVSRCVRAGRHGSGLLRGKKTSVSETALIFNQLILFSLIWRFYRTLFRSGQVSSSPARDQTNTASLWRCAGVRDVQVETLRSRVKICLCEKWWKVTKYIFSVLLLQLCGTCTVPETPSDVRAVFGDSKSSVWV